MTKKTNDGGETHYQVLGVSRTASQDEISHAFRQQLRAHHPDTRARDTAADSDPSATLERLIAAYTVLRDPERRAAYDRAIPGAPSASPTTRIGVTHHQDLSTGQPVPPPPLWAGPVRHHRRNP